MNLLIVDVLDGSELITIAVSSIEDVLRLRKYFKDTKALLSVAEHDKLERVVGRFLSWKLPKEFCPDAGISFNPSKSYEGDEYGNDCWWPIGTNLLTAAQAREMIMYILDIHNK